MKTLVKYVERELLLTAVCPNFPSRTMKAGKLSRCGLGDNTVQEDGKTVYVSKDQYKSLILNIKT